jgi:DNA-binding CsgD family transcriptional regulator
MVLMQKLTNREIRLLSCLADGSTYQEIASFLGMSIPNVHTTCHGIRQKTGIRQTRDREECARYLATLPPEMVKHALCAPKREAPSSLTFCQLDAFRLLASGQSYDQIAQTLGIQPQSVQNLITRACKRAGITHQGWNRTERIRHWLERNDGQRASVAVSPMDDPMF